MCASSIKRVKNAQKAARQATKGETEYRAGFDPDFEENHRALVSSKENSSADGESSDEF